MRPHSDQWQLKLLSFFLLETMTPLQMTTTYKASISQNALYIPQSEKVSQSHLQHSSCQTIAKVCVCHVAYIKAAVALNIRIKLLECYTCEFI